MKRFVLIMLSGVVSQLAAQQPNCTPLPGNRILASDLAAVVPAFGAIPADTLLGNTPGPGSQRIFHAPELLSLAQRYGLSIGTDASACFTRSMEALDRGAVLAAMLSALQIPNARVEIAETSMYPVPHGLVEFRLDHLGVPASADQRSPVLWRGDVIYGDDHRFAIWATVRILAHCSELVASENLKPGAVIQASQVRVSDQVSFPAPRKERLRVDQVVGMTVVRPIAAGSILHAEMISRPNDISRGDLVEIEVVSGAARLLLTARAESGGHGGEAILVRNLESNRVFSAQITGKGKAIVSTDFRKAE